MKTGTIGLAAAAVLAAVVLVGSDASGKGAGKENFKPEYDAAGTRIINIPDPTKDPEAFAKYFIWTKVKNTKDFLTKQDLGITDKKKWEEIDTSGDEKASLKEIIAMVKAEVAKLEAKKGPAKKDDGSKK